MTPIGDLSPLLAVLLITEYFALGFTVVYALANSALILLGFRPAREHVRALAYHDLDMMDHDPDCAPIAVLVPAYNEERGIVDSVRTFLQLDYPRLEIIVVNDGSKDGTLTALRSAFRLRQHDSSEQGRLHTAVVRGVYECGISLPANVVRFIVVDKENGGRADALNCALNTCRSPYFVTVDADSILDPSSLKLVMRAFQEDPSVDAVGGQIGIVNDSLLEGGRVTQVRVPRRYLPLCQALEYVRSFTTARTGWSRLGCLLILSGAFLVTRRETALAIGGFLTGRVHSRLLAEYSGRGRGTVGEDMELIVRLHRYGRETGRPAKVVHTPLPVCWTEVPSTWRVLARQRRRWHRGLLEIVRYHRTMLLNPTYGRVGLLAFPYVVAFEFCGPYIEALGYLMLPFVVLLGVLDAERAVLLAAVALGFGVLHSLVSVLCATWLEPVVPARTHMRSLLGMDRWHDRLRLVAACALGELGYRQATVWWRLQGTWEYLRGVHAWGDMERRGFRTAASSAAKTAAFALVLLGAGPAEGSAAFREAALFATTEHRDGHVNATWFEGRHRWAWERSEGRHVLGLSAGAYTLERNDDHDAGFLLGAEAALGAAAGTGLELRAAPGASASAQWSVSLEGESGVVAPLSVTWIARASRFADSSVLELVPGAIVYLPADAWVGLRGHFIRTSFDAGGDDSLGGASLILSAPFHGTEMRFLALTGGESYFTGASLEPGRVRSRSAGLVVRAPIAEGWKVESGVSLRVPERGDEDLTLHAGVRRRF
jgi:cellulose synthase/poly-beta-1,6-N-acetylglucosamine synthase-like glycosyltransferase